MRTKTSHEMNVSGRIHKMISLEFIDFPSQQDDYLDTLWIQEECYKFYINQRKRNCSFLQILDLWLQAPFCTSCAQSDPYERFRDADIFPDNWQLDILIHLGGKTLKKIDAALNNDSDFALTCKSCSNELKPWEGDFVYVVNYHLEGHYGIPLETNNRKVPSKKLKRKIIDLYDRKCFHCENPNKELHIDHILPQSKGGDAAFRNLQPLCTECGNIKADQLPKEVEVFSDIYFEKYPSDSYEGLFWQPCQYHA